MRKAALVYSPRFKEYDLGPSHPMKPVRVERTYELIRACGLLEPDGVSVVKPSPADDSTLALIHSQEYLDAVRAPSEGRPVRRPYQFGLGTSDNPITEGIYEATALVVGASVLAADLVADGEAAVAFNPAGGLHHAHRSRAAGFCVFNDPAIAIAYLLQRCGEGVKVAYLDIDAHHGDGVQEAFYQRRDVLTISLHESGRFLFPVTGEVSETGEGEGEGFSVNLPLSPYTNDETYLWAFREAIIPILEAFAPDYICTQLGADTHYQDPLTHMCLTTHGYLAVIDEIAARFPRWIAVGGGGYHLAVVPRAWTLAFACMTGADPPSRIPASQAGRYRLEPAPARASAKARKAASSREKEAQTEEEQAPPLHDTSVPTIDEDWARAAREFAEESVAEIEGRLFPLHGLRA
jgi:acetoin utilization protein AcuC